MHKLRMCSIVQCRKPKKGQQKIKILKKTTGLCPSRINNISTVLYSVQSTVQFSEEERFATELNFSLNGSLKTL